jgi:Cd2+/Zn2+-exporting ATPase
MNKKYYLKNVDCTECAYNIEANVRGLDGVTFVSINMAAGTMYLDASDTASVLAKIKSIEPAVEIIDADEWSAENKVSGTPWI